MYLNTHSRFSLRYGVLSVDDMLSWAQAAGVTRMALTDVGTTSANWDFVRRAERFGVTPVLGVDVRNGNTRRFVALARHAAGPFAARPGIASVQQYPAKTRPQYPVR